MRKILTYGAITAILIALFTVSWVLSQPGSDTLGIAATQSFIETRVFQPPFDMDLNPAMNAPDMFNWELMATLVAPVGNNLDEALFQTFATDGDTFPPSPKPSICDTTSPPPAANCPVFPEGERTEDFGASAQQLGVIPCSTPATIAESCELVYRNRASFDYIVENNLWYLEGLIDAYDNNFVVKFPVEAIEFKTNWITITPDQMDQYHSAVDSDGDLFGLVAFHIMSKQIPNWTWATFEHVDNPGRCDFIGCHDEFGQTPAIVEPYALEGGKVYPAETLSPELLLLFEEHNLPSVWQNYRLKGSMTDFTDSIGRANLLGNSVTERGFVPSSSCMTCHGKASIRPTGDGKAETLAIFESFKPGNQAAVAGSVTSTNPPVVWPRVSDEALDGFTSKSRISANGTPNPNWFVVPLTCSMPITGCGDGAVNFLQLDFVWAFFNAQPIAP